MQNLKDALVAYLTSLKRDDADKAASTLSKWGLEFGFNRTGNATDHKTWTAAIAGKDQTQSRVSLDRYENDTPCIVVNRTMATSYQEVVASALHGAILAWRRDSGEAITKDGKERLLDAAFASLASYAGLTKIAEELPAKDGKPRKVSDTARRAWYGLSGGLVAFADRFAETAGELPPAFTGTPDKGDVHGSLMLPAIVDLASGSRIDGYLRIPNYDAQPENARRVFATYDADPSIRFSEKNKGVRFFRAQLAKAEAPQQEKAVDASPIAEASKAVKPRKPQPQASV